MMLYKDTDHAILELPYMDTTPTPQSDPQNEIHSILADVSSAQGDTPHKDVVRMGLSPRSQKIVALIVVFVAIVVVLVVVLNKKVKNVGLSPEQKSAIISDIKKHSAYDVLTEPERQALSEGFKNTNQNIPSLTDEQKQSIRNNTNAQ
ncbi:MAG: hypothetical protein KBB88_01595 [Candidatus Pacebacteria bacterium]|nr:hypothetical protein [Candidatus Paceibacterota bacterium]